MKSFHKIVIGCLIVIIVIQGTGLALNFQQQKILTEKLNTYEEKMESYEEKMDKIDTLLDVSFAHKTSCGILPANSNLNCYCLLAKGEDYLL